MKILVRMPVTTEYISQDKRLVNCNNVAGKSEPSDNGFTAIFLSQPLGTVQRLLTEVASKVRLVRFRLIVLCRRVVRT